MVWSAVAEIYDPLKAGSIDATDTIAHDHGVVRALNSKYKPNKDVKGDPETTIFVGRLHHNTTEDTLESVFSEQGDIVRLRLVRDIVTGHSRGYAFVEYETPREAHRAISMCNKTLIDSTEIFVDMECERVLPGWKPRRLGGGIGGKKESGQLRFGGIDRPFRQPVELMSRPQFFNRNIAGESDSRETQYSKSGNYGNNSRSNYRQLRYSRSRSRERSRRRSRSDSRDRSKRRERSRCRNRDRRSRRSRSREDKNRKGRRSRSRQRDNRRRSRSLSRT